MTVGKVAEKVAEQLNERAFVDNAKQELNQFVISLARWATVTAEDQRLTCDQRTDLKHAADDVGLALYALRDVREALQERAAHDLWTALSAAYRIGTLAVFPDGAKRILDHDKTAIMREGRQRSERENAVNKAMSEASAAERRLSIKEQHALLNERLALAGMGPISDPTFRRRLKKAQFPQK